MNIFSSSCVSSKPFDSMYVCYYICYSASADALISEDLSFSSTCQGGINRRETQVVFTLLSPFGEPLGRAVIDLR